MLKITVIMWSWGTLHLAKDNEIPAWANVYNTDIIMKSIAEICTDLFKRACVLSRTLRSGDLTLFTLKNHVTTIDIIRQTHCVFWQAALSVSEGSCPGRNDRKKMRRRKEKHSQCGAYPLSGRLLNVSNSICVQKWNKYADCFLPRANDLFDKTFAL